MSREVFKCLLFFYEAGWWTPFIILELVLVGPGVDSFRESKRGKAVSLCSYSRYSVVWGKTKPFSSVTHCNFPLQKEKNVCLWCVHCLQCGAQHISMLVISIFLVFFFFFPPWLHTQWKLCLLWLKGAGNNFCVYMTISFLFWNTAIIGFFSFSSCPGRDLRHE